MPHSLRSLSRQAAVAVRAMALLTVLLGLAYPLIMTAVGQVALPGRADGSLLRDADGTVVGSALIGQSFTDREGEPVPRYFQTRPSAAGEGYDGAASSGSNLGPSNPDLLAAVQERRAAVAVLEGVPESLVPADAVTASASGLDPHISPAYAELQVDRVARERGFDPQRVRALVADHTSGPLLGYLSESTVNVVELNLALDSEG